MTVYHALCVMDRGRDTDFSLHFPIQLDSWTCAVTCSNRNGDVFCMSKVVEI